MNRREALKAAGAAIAAAGLGDVVQAEMIDAAVAGMIVRYPANMCQRNIHALKTAFATAYQNGALDVNVLLIPNYLEVEMLSADEWARVVK